jgi:hypothetical protein
MRTKRTIWVGAITLAAVALLTLAGCTAQTSPVLTAKHPPYPTGQPCAECHDKDKTHLPPYKGACDRCHGLTSWRAITYTHADDVFNQGRHATLGCIYCHKEGYPPPSAGCGACHTAPHDGWTECGECHVPLTWLLHRPLPRGHLSLAGDHARLSCLDCHARAKAAARPRSCTNCHGTKHGGLTDCAKCHDPANNWRPGAFDHSVFFRITGRHTRLKCTSCHPGGRFAGTPAGCVGCHGTKHGGLTNCAKCHTTSTFEPSTFRHSSVFALTPGPHARLACTRCHPSQLYARVNGHSCADCHGHKHGGLRVCTPCHTRTGALTGTVTHSVFFPLVGAHSALACSACHGSPFHPAPGTHCVDCHHTKHGGVTACDDCHTTSAFSPIHSIAHPGGVRLAGHHASRSGCAECHHTPLDFIATPRSCTSSGCHTVPHAGPSDCLRCHYPVASWRDVHFTHPPLRDGHGPGDGACSSCHTGGSFTDTAGWTGCICH